MSKEIIWMQKTLCLNWLHNLTFLYFCYSFIITISKSLAISICDWLAVSSVIYPRITLFFALHQICSKLPHSCSNWHHFCFKSHHFCSILHNFFNTKLEVKAFLFPLFDKPATRSIKYIDTDWIPQFQNGCNNVVIELCVMQFWSEIILVSSNWYFQIMHMISDQIALHSIQLPLFIF